MMWIVYFLAVCLFCCIIFLMWIVWQYRLEPQKMGSVPQALATLVGALLLMVGWFVTNQQSIDRDITTKQRETLTSVAEYLSLASSLKGDDSPEVYRKANQMAWQLAIWLPPDLYRKVIHGVAQKEFRGNWEALIAVRSKLLGPDAYDLGPEDAIFHAPGIGKGNK